MEDWKSKLSSLEGLKGGLEPEAEEMTAVPVPGKPLKHMVTVFYERKGRGGKEVTILADFTPALNPAELESLASDLKKSLGCGGAARGGEILLQGDRRARVRQVLDAKNFKTKGL